MTRGYITLAFGDPRFTDLALNLARSLSWHDSEIPRAIVTDNCQHPLLKKWFNYLIPLDQTKGEGNAQKAFLYDYSPFEETMVIDSDCLALRPLKELWEKLSIQDFSVLGTNVSKGKWRYDIAHACNQLGVKTIPKFNGGCYYFKKGEMARQIATRFQELASHYNTTLAYLGVPLSQSRSVSEELCLSIALAEKNIAALEAYSSREMIGPIQLTPGKVQFNILYGKFHCITEGKTFKPFIGHFFHNLHKGFHYRRECHKLRISLKYQISPRLTHHLVNWLWNPPYWVFTFLYSSGQRLTKKNPIHVMACIRPDSFFKNNFRFLSSIFKL
jgi:hypothetical protein